MDLQHKEICGNALANARGRPRTGEEDQSLDAGVADAELRKPVRVHAGGGRVVRVTKRR